MNNVGCNKYGNESRVPWWCMVFVSSRTVHGMSPGDGRPVNRSHVTTRIGLSALLQKNKVVSMLMRPSGL